MKKSPLLPTPGADWMTSKPCALTPGCATELTATGPVLRHRAHGPCGVRHSARQIRPSPSEGRPLVP
jgi:hypothetical protein